MRIIVLAVLFACVGLTGLLAAVLALDLRGAAIGPLTGIAGFLVVVGSLVLAERIVAPPFKDSLTLQDLKDQGLLEYARYKAVRAFGVEEHDDEGSHYFLELIDGRVLYLCGQYLYDYEIEHGDWLKRRFPCTEFATVKDTRSGDIIDLECSGAAFEPEHVFPAAARKVFAEQDTPADGQVLNSHTYNELAELIRARAD